MELIKCLEQVEETRSYINQDYPLIEISFLLVTALTCGQKGWADIKDFGEGNLDWLRHYLPFEFGIPTSHNIARIVRAIKPHTLLSALVDWVNLHRTRQERPIIAVDGKELNGVAKHGAKNVLNMVSAFDVEQGLVLYHRACEGKGKEIEAVKSLIHCLDVTGAIITADALHCQSDTLALITSKKGDALVQVKANQPSLFETVDNAFQSYWEQPQAEQQSLEISNQGHGRKERRTVYQLPAHLNGTLQQKWSMVASFIAVVRERTKGNRTSYETAYYVCTDTLGLELAAKATRRHWHIENQQHWILDVVFREDEQTIHAGKSAENMACFRRFVMNLLRCDETKLSMPRKMNKASWDENYRHQILFTN
jgi:predicted transposase YbfD/YdcC